MKREQISARFQSRISYRGSVEDVSQRICKDFKLGSFVSNRVITTGYEDFNVAIETTKGTYLAKIFADFRDAKDCKRYVEVMSRAHAAGVALPRLYASDQGYLHQFKLGEAPVRLCLTDYVDGKTFYELKTSPKPEEIKFLARQAALISSIDIRPHCIYDSWAIVNLPKEFEEKARYLQRKDASLVRSVLENFNALDIEHLPHCLVHGDLISTNVMRDRQRRVWVLDFAVSNWYPRVQELAVLACDLLFDERSKDKSEKNLELAVREYQKSTKLTASELDILPLYIRAAHAMHVLLAGYQKVAKHNTSKENEYFLRIGRAGLRQTVD